MAGKKTKLELLDKLFVGILLVIFGGIVLHAPLSVGLQSLFPAAELLVKSWKEILMILAGLLVVVTVTRRKQWEILRSPLVLLIGLYAALHLVLIPAFPSEAASVIAGLMIDLRYLFFFVLVYVAIRMYPQLRRAFVGTFVAGALIVVSFAILQVTVLPHDILKYIGYSETTIMPFLTVDQNMDFVRISSTLRGPNPLGAFALIVLTLLTAFWFRGNHRQFKHPMFVLAVLGVGGLVALWASYSRSALIAALVAIGLVGLIVAGRKLSKLAWLGLAVGVLALGGVLFAARGTEYVSNVILHENIHEGGDVNSNEGHVDSLSDGVTRMLRQPLGGGIGSTGSASLYTDSPLIIENQYLFIAHEVGWIGLVLFLMIFWRVLKELWARRTDWLGLGVFASGIGLALIGLLLPVWVDDTVSIIWWGLAAVVIGGTYGRAIDKKAKRTA